MEAFIVVLVSGEQAAEYGLVIYGEREPPSGELWYKASTIFDLELNERVWLGSSINHCLEGRVGLCSLQDCAQASATWLSSLPKS